MYEELSPTTVMSVPDHGTPILRCSGRSTAAALKYPAVLLCSVGDLKKIKGLSPPCFHARFPESLALLVVSP